MSPRGYKVFRHNGLYFVWSQSTDGHHEKPGLGWDLWKMIPTDRNKFLQWVQLQRTRLDRYHMQYQVGRERMLPRQRRDKVIGFCISKAYLKQSLTVPYTYVVDLDQLIFSVEGTPIFHLDNMPPWDVFHQTFIALQGDKDGGKVQGEYVFAEAVPDQYRFDITRLLVPAIAEDDGRLETYARFCTGIVTAPHDILSLREALSPCEQVCLRVLENHVGVYFYKSWDIIMQDVRLSRDAESMGEQGRDIAITLAASALLPLHVLGTVSGTMLDGRPCQARWADHYAGHQDEFWFIRRHICLHLTTHLHDTRCLQTDVSDTVNKILSIADGPSVVYGVIFSLISCVVVRVDKAAGGFFSHTEVLPFLPISMTAETWSTPSMELLRRLGNLRAADDVDWFYSKLSPMWWMECSESLEDADGSPGESRKAQLKSPRKKRKISGNANEVHNEVVRSEASKTRNLPRLPFEVLAIIAGHIALPDFLFNFALASRVTMAASIPRLRYPQFRAYFRHSGTKLDSCFACFLECCERSLYEGKSHSLAFRTRFRGLPALVMITPEGMCDKWQDKRTSLQEYAGDRQLESTFLIPHCVSPVTDSYHSPTRHRTHPRFSYGFDWQVRRSAIGFTM